jgi:hypothetical protein
MLGNHLMRPRAELREDPKYAEIYATGAAAAAQGKPIRLHGMMIDGVPSVMFPRVFTVLEVEAVARSFNGTRGQSSAAGWDHLCKPFKFEYLPEEIRNVINDRQEFVRPADAGEFESIPPVLAEAAASFSAEGLVKMSEDQKNFLSNPLVVCDIVVYALEYVDLYGAPSTKASRDGSLAATSGLKSAISSSSSPSAKAIHTAGNTTGPQVKNAVLMNGTLTLTVLLTTFAAGKVGAAYAAKYASLTTACANLSQPTEHLSDLFVQVRFPTAIPDTPVSITPFLVEKFKKADKIAERIAVLAAAEALTTVASMCMAGVPEIEVRKALAMLTLQMDIDYGAASRPLLNEIVADEQRFKETLYDSTSVMCLSRGGNAELGIFFSSVVSHSQGSTAGHMANTQYATASGATSHTYAATAPVFAAPVSEPTPPVMTQDEMIQKVASAAAKAAAEETKKKLASEFKAIREGQEKSQADALKYQAEQQKQLSDMKSNLSSVSKKVNQQQGGRGGQNNATNPQ